MANRCSQSGETGFGSNRGLAITASANADPGRGSDPRDGAFPRHTCRVLVVTSDPVLRRQLRPWRAMSTSLLWQATLLLRALPFCLVVVDARQAGRDRAERSKLWAHAAQAKKVVVVSGGSRWLHDRELGVDIVVANGPRDDLTQAFRYAFRRRCRAPRAGLDHQGLLDAATRAWDLSLGEALVAHFMLKGLANREISKELRFGERRVEMLVQSIAKKAGCDPALNRRVQLVLGMVHEAAQSGWPAAAGQRNSRVHDACARARPLL